MKIESADLTTTWMRCPNPKCLAFGPDTWQHCVECGTPLEPCTCTGCELRRAALAAAGVPAASPEVIYSYQI